MKHSGGLSFGVDVSEQRQVDVSRSGKSPLTGTWAERAREGTDAGQRRLMGNWEVLW